MSDATAKLITKILDDLKGHPNFVIANRIAAELAKLRESQQKLPVCARGNAACRGRRRFNTLLCPVSSQMVIAKNEPLMEAASALDTKFEELVARITGLI
jgi:hypothetical protein